MTALPFTVWHVSEHARLVGGIERNTVALARGLAEGGLRQIVLTASGEEVDPEFGRAFDYRVQLGGLQDLERLAADLPRPDVIVIQRPFGGLRIVDWKRFAPVIRVVHDHDLVCPRRHKYYPLSHRICTRPFGAACVMHGCLLGKDAAGRVRLLSLAERKRDVDDHLNADALVVASRFMRDELVANGLPPASIHILPPLPGDLAVTSPSTLAETTTVLFVGQLIRGKGPDLLIRALSRLARPWRLLIAGEGNLRPELEKLCATLKLEERVVFLGKLSHGEVLDLYRQAAVVAVPSRWPEPFGMVGLEAMAAARPVVGFSVGGIRDWLWHGVNGLGVPPASVSALAEQLDRLLADPRLAHDLGRNGRRLLEKHYRFEDYASAFIRLFNRMAGRSSGGEPKGGPS